MELILAISTLLGGAAAVWFFWEKARSRKGISRLSFFREPAILLEPRSLFAYANGSERLHSLTRRVAEKRGFEVEPIDSESAWLNEKLRKLEVATIREVDLYVRKFGEAAVKLTDYVTPQGAIDTGFILGMVLEIVAIDRGGKEGVRAFHRDLQFSGGGQGWADEMFEAYQQIKGKRMGAGVRIAHLGPMPTPTETASLTRPDTRRQSYLDVVNKVLANEEESIHAYFVSIQLSLGLARKLVFHPSSAEAVAQRL